MLKDIYNVWVVLFDNRDILYHVDTPVISIDIPAENDNAFHKLFRVLRRSRAVRSIKREKKITHAISFGQSANLVNVMSKGREMVLSGIRGNTQLKSKLTSRIVIPFSNKIIAVCPEMERELKDSFPKKCIKCIPNPVDIDEVQAKGHLNHEISKKRNVIKLFTMGRIVWEKGYWHLLKACSVLCKKGYDFELVHAGTGDTSSYNKLAEELQIADKIHFLGQLENPFQEMQDADVFVLSSCSEGLPNVILEAMAMGVPVVSANCRTGPAGMLHDDWEEAASHRHEVFLADYGILAPDMGRAENMNAEEIEEEDFMLAEAIEKMLQSKNVHERYKQQGSVRVKDFSKEKYLERITSYLE